MTRIYFTDFFDVDPGTLEAYGAFNVSLINDLPLFIDPFLLFDSDKPEYVALHHHIIEYVKFLRDRSLDTDAQGLLDEWFLFPEVKQNWLGFSRQGNRGTGLGCDFARALQRNLAHAFQSFGTETITRSSHLEKLCLIDNGVGRDHLSDFTTNLIKGFLLEYTEAFAKEHVDASKRGVFAVRKVRFDYATRRWRDGRFTLPSHDGQYVVLTPKDILTKDEAWINRADLLDRFRDILPALPDAIQRARVTEYFHQRLSERPTPKEISAAAAATIAQFPEILDHYIRRKEDTGSEAHAVSDEKVRDTEQQFIHQLRTLVGQLAGTEFYKRGDTFEEALARVHFLKHVIEDNDGYRVFYLKGKPIKREADLQIMYRLTWFASDLDVNREVNNGRGPVDFKASRGAADKTLIEFKLASNSKLPQNLKHQVGVYEAANDTSKSIKVIMFFTEQELKRVRTVLADLGLDNRRDVVLIDARGDKVSASKVSDVEGS